MPAIHIYLHRARDAAVQFSFEARLMDKEGHWDFSETVTAADINAARKQIAKAYPPSRYRLKEIRQTSWS